jgi:hypothetical protein
MIPQQCFGIATPVNQECVAERQSSYQRERFFAVPSLSHGDQHAVGPRAFFRFFTGFRRRKPGAVRRSADLADRDYRGYFNRRFVMAFKFKGRDRRLIKKTLLLLNNIVARDVLALNVTKKTTKLSTRTLILDNNASPGGLYASAQLLIANCVAKLALTS